MCGNFSFSFYYINTTSISSIFVFFVVKQFRFSFHSLFPPITKWASSWSLSMVLAQLSSKTFEPRIFCVFMSFHYENCVSACRTSKHCQLYITLDKHKIIVCDKRILSLNFLYFSNVTGFSGPMVFFPHNPGTHLTLSLSLTYFGAVFS